MFRKSLAQQLAELNDVRPQDFYEEDGDQALDSQDSDGADGDLNSARAKAHYLDVGRSNLRADELEDPKYSGQKVSRNSVFMDLDDEASVGDSKSDEDSQRGVSPADTAIESEGSDQDEPEDEPESGEKPETREEQAVEPSNEIQNLQLSREADRRKGRSVSRQIAIWETLINARIQLQKAVQGCNLLASTLQSQSKVDDLSALEETLHDLSGLQDECEELQQSVSGSLRTEISPRKRRRLDVASGRSHEEITECTEHFFAGVQSFHPETLQTLTKWSNKVNAASLLSAKDSKKSFLASREQAKSAVELVVDTLEGPNHAKLIGRTRVRRGLDMTTPDGIGGDSLVFDDTDFYQELLRDVIDSKTGNAENQQAWETARSKKVKKLVDTRASKGRKLRYEVHEKIQNFMVPTRPRGGWPEEQIDELYTSLFGGSGRKRSDSPSNVVAVSLDGFQIF